MLLVCCLCAAYMLSMCCLYAVYALVMCCMCAGSKEKKLDKMG
jgi:hypothetical protein